MSVEETAAVVLGSCVACVTLQEKMRSEEGEMFTLINFAFFLSVVVVGTWTNKFRRRIVPLNAYFGLAALFSFSTYLNGYALQLRTSYPAFIVIRSTALPANMIVSVVWQGRRYSAGKIASVLAMTAGVVVFTFDFRHHSLQSVMQDLMGGDNAGVGYLIIALFAGAILGVWQEKVNSRYGRSVADESMYWIYALSLPMIFMQKWDLFDQAEAAWRRTRPLEGRLGGFTTIAIITLLQFVCTSRIFDLSARTSSLTTNAVLTVRKILSLGISVWLFNHDFLPHHYTGAALVFGGAFVYANVD